MYSMDCKCINVLVDRSVEKENEGDCHVVVERNESEYKLKLDSTILSEK